MVHGLFITLLALLAKGIAGKGYMKISPSWIMGKILPKGKSANKNTYREGKMRKQIFLLLAVAATWACHGCNPAEDALEVDLSRREAVTMAPSQNVITYAYLPQYSHAVSFARHGKLVEYLKEATGLPLLQVYPNTFDEHVKMVERGEIDISFSNPFIYINLARNGAEAFARIVENDDKSDFRGQIITRKDNKTIKTLDDCRGKRWIAVDPSSAGGYLFALGLFMDHGITRQDFSEVAFAPGPGGKQEKVVLAVYAGKFDIGSIREGTLEVVGGKVELERLRVLAETPFYPGWVFANRKGLDREITDRIAQALLRLDKMASGKDILRAAGFKAIIKAEDQDYDSIRALAAKLGMN
jgi:phosphonate transport system substrate-binding protein